jgi:hypothetical protein
VTARRKPSKAAELRARDRALIEAAIAERGREIDARRAAVAEHRRFTGLDAEVRESLRPRSRVQHRSGGETA